MSTTWQLSENSHRGFEGIKAALCLASMEAKSNVASGMPACLRRNGIGSRSSGKERDAETGLDYFGARYYSGAQGRFTSPDPLLNSGKPDIPQSWNRYSYVRNNPLTRIDPTGLYDVSIDPACAGDKKCKEQFNKAADQLKKGLDKLQKRLGKVKDPLQKARLTAALDAMGTQGDGNGVTVTFGATQNGGAGQTIPVYDPTTNKETYNVTFDPQKINGKDDYAVVGAHEGTHIDDINYQLANPSGIIASDFSMEYRGYQTTAYAAAALGHNSWSIQYDHTSYQIWNGSWGAVDKNITNLVTKFHDKNGKQTHPETKPHNPWPGR